MCIDCWFSYLSDVLAIIASVPTLVLCSVSEGKFLNMEIIINLFFIREKQ